MELNKSARESLDFVRVKVLANNIKWTTDEKIHLQTVYQAITKKVLSLNCESCWVIACKIISNFINFYETTPLDVVLETEVIKVKKTRQRRK